MLNCRNTNMSLGPFVRPVCACGMMLGGHPCQSEAVETCGSCERCGCLKGGVSAGASLPTPPQRRAAASSVRTPQSAPALPGTSARPVSSSVTSLWSSWSLSGTALLQE